MRNYCLLIVDDDEIDRRLYTKLLANTAPEGCEIHCAADGAAGLEALRTRIFDCVLLDLNLPDMTGLEFLSTAATDGQLPCAMVLVTGHGSEAIAVEAMKRGAQDYLVKDIINERRLWRVVRVAVDQAELRQQLAFSLRELTTANTALKEEVASRKAAETRLRLARDAAEQANRAKTRVLAMVTHELRTPLNGLLGYAQLLRIEDNPTPRQETRIAAMMQAGQHLLDMIESVLDFAMIENGRMDMHPSSFRLDALVADCITFVRPLAAQRGLGLFSTVSPEVSLEITTDAARLRQVLLNLLGNAIKFTKDGEVELRVLPGHTEHRLRIEIADSGPGIDESSRARLFQNFARLGPTSAAEGAGLGLSIAARIVDFMGGTLGHTPRPAGGSIFWIDLPCAPPLPAPAALPAAPTPGAPSRILLVDDIAMNRDVVGAFMRAAGFEAVLAEDGRTAIQLAAEQQFDLILMDIRMPQMDGIEATRRIRALPNPHGQVPILALSAYASHDNADECRAAGMDGHLSKPVEYASFASVLTNAITQGHQAAATAPA